MVLSRISAWMREPASAKPRTAARTAGHATPGMKKRSTSGAGVDAWDAVHPDYDLTVSIIPSQQRTYGFLLHERISGETAVVDPMDAGPIIALARARGGTINHVFNTHYHNCAGNVAIKRATGCKIHGPAAEADRIPGLDVGYKGGESFSLGKLTGTVMATPGHTFGHIALWLGPAGVLFCGDSLTPLGCARLVDGTPHEMWRSLDAIRHLPPETLIYSGFECAQSNARFALTIDRDNLWLKTRAKRIEAAAKEGRASVPSKLEDEHVTNPFVRADDPRIAAAIGMPSAGPIEVLTELRKRRDQFQFQPH
jgi:hydroxyacylglutathione hydrolase